VLFPWGQSGRVVKLTTYLHLVPVQECVKLYLQSPIRLHVVFC